MFPRAPLPDQIGPYRVLRRLSSAGGADLYLGREEGPMGFTRMVMLKLAPVEDDPEVAKELGHEAAIVARLNHAAIVRMYHFFEHDKRLVLVLERVEGTNLAKLLAAARRRKQKMPDEVVFHVAHRLASAISHAHSMADENGQLTPVVHRSISPSALLVSWNGDVRLSGFGLAKIMGRSPDTAVGLVKGTPGYMAPEQLRGERVTARVDIYQAGLVIWELLAGNPPAQANAPQKSKEAELVQLIGGVQRMTSVSMLRPTIPREIAAVFDAMLEPTVEKRTISAAEVERWLAKTVDVERGREMLRERAVPLRALEARDAVPTAEVARNPGGSGRRAPPRSMTSGGRSATSQPRSLRASTLNPADAPAPASSPGRSVTIEPVNRSATFDPANRATTFNPNPGIFELRAPSNPEAPPAEPPAIVNAAASPSEPRINRVTLPEPAEGEPALVAMPVEGERGAATAVTRAPLPRRRINWLVVGGGIGAVVLVGGGIATYTLSGGETPPPPPPSASAPPAPPPPPASSAPPEPPPPPEIQLPVLAANQAAILVKASTEGYVYINGAMIGETGKVLVTVCGQRFVRVGSKKGGQVLWLSKGASLKFPCGKLTEVDLSVPPRPGAR